MRKIRLGQGVARACYHDGFHDLGTFDEAPGTVQSTGSALTRNFQDFPSGNPSPPSGSCNIARQRGPIGSERSPGPRQMYPNAEIRNSMHARHLGIT